MPFKSEAQRRFMYSQHPELAKEFESVTPKGADLPEHVKHMADGGMSEDNENNAAEQFREGFKGEINHDSDAVRSYLSSKFSQLMGTPTEDTVAKSSDTARGMAKGGMPLSPEAVQHKPSNTTSTPFAEGGKVERSSLALPVPNAMMARAMNEGGVTINIDAAKQPEMAPAVSMNPIVAKGLPGVPALPGAQPTPDESLSSVIDNLMKQMPPKNMAEGGYPHVTFLENETPEKVREVTHLAAGPHTETTTTETGEKKNPPHMAKGGAVPHAPGGDVHVNRESHMSVPIVSKDTEFHLKRTPDEMAKDAVGDTVKVALPATVTSKEGDMERVKTHGDAEVQKDGKAMPITISSGGVNDPKLKAIYKAMGIKKYADGGVSTSDGAVDASQLPGGGMTPPSPSDPTYWDQIKSVLSRLTNSPAATAANAIANPVSGITNAVEGAAPAILKAELPPVSNVASTLTSGAIPTIPSTPTAPKTFAPITAADVPPAVPPMGPSPASVTTPSASTTGMPNLKALYNQDTSKLTAGVNPEDRQALANQLQSQQHGIGAIIAQAVAGLGDALAAKGGKEQHSLQNIFSMQKTQRDETLSNFDVARQDRIQKLALQTQMGDNALKQAAAADAYGVDDHLNQLIGAPKGTMKKDLPTYFSLMSAQVAQQEKDADLYMKAHAQASTDVDNAVKNASVLGVKPSAAQLQASGAKLADNYYHRAKGNVLIHSSDGQTLWIPATNLQKAKQLDPTLQVQP